MLNPYCLDCLEPFSGFGHQPSRLLCRLSFVSTRFWLDCRPKILSILICFVQAFRVILEMSLSKDLSGVAPVCFKLLLVLLTFHQVAVDELPQKCNSSKEELRHDYPDLKAGDDCPVCFKRHKASVAIGDHFSEGSFCFFNSPD